MNLQELMADELLVRDQITALREVGGEPLELLRARRFPSLSDEQLIRILEDMLPFADIPGENGILDPFRGFPPPIAPADVQPRNQSELEKCRPPVTEERVRELSRCAVAVVESRFLDSSADRPPEKRWKLELRDLKLCETQRFSRQKVISGKPASGFLVAPDLVATAAHVILEKPVSKYRFVVDFRSGAGDQVPNHFAEDQVFEGSEYQIGGSTDDDWALVKLDRKVPGDRPILPLNPGMTSEDASLFMIGHPLGMPVKFSGCASILENHGRMQLKADLDALKRSSGSMVINASTGHVEGILSSTGHGSLGETRENDVRCLIWRLCDAGECRYSKVVRSNRFAALVADYRRA